MRKSRMRFLRLDDLTLDIVACAIAAADAPSFSARVEEARRV